MIEAIFARLGYEQAWAPSLWWLEVANALQMGVRRLRYIVAKRSAYLTLLRGLPIFPDRQTRRHAWTESLALSDRHGLTVYDAAYLELALRRGLPLATLDRELRRAAEAEGITLLGT